ncbi:uncharacterized protein [Antennarius striatus]|uniref:uncharacterized protein n=1 Tax=Antennarius striatus TaxID=241820 RepID=UPI0035B289FE
MDPWREHFWLWVTVGMVVVSLLIGLVFIFINKCISRAGKHRISSLRSRSDFNTESNKYQQRVDDPPFVRTPVVSGAESHENMEESTHDYEKVVPDYQQDVPDYQQDVPDYEQDEPDYEQDVPDYEQDVPDYEQDVPDYEQEMFDYVKVVDDTSTEDYDDIGDDKDLHDDEDYDDLG